MEKNGHGTSEFAKLAEAYIQAAREVHKRGEGLLNYFLEMAEMELAEVLARDAATDSENALGIQMDHGDKGRVPASSRSL